MKTAKGEREEGIDRCNVVIENVISCASLSEDFSLGFSFRQETLNDETCAMSYMTNTEKCEFVCKAEWMKTGRELKVTGKKETLDRQRDGVVEIVRG